MENNKQRDLAVHGQWIAESGAHEYPSVAYRQSYLGTRFSLFRKCERCRAVMLMLKMVHVSRPLGGRPYWICRSCRPSG
jgi:hypothetical protein